MKNISLIFITIILSLSLISCESLPFYTGSKVYEDGSEYIGEFSYGKRSGKGTLTEADGDVYTGEWKDGWANGQGIGTSADGTIYVGEFKDGKPTGQGTTTTPDGTTYVGEYENNFWYFHWQYTDNIRTIHEEI